MKLRSFFSLLFFACVSVVDAQTLNAIDFGLVPNNQSQDASPILSQICDSARVLSQKGKKVKIQLEKGKYYFHPDKASERVYYVSNHDQPNPKKVGIALENLKNVTFEGNGADLLFYGQMMPMSLVGCTDCTLRNFSIDFVTPHLAQAEIVANDGQSISYKMASWDKWEIKDSVLYYNGDGWRYHADWAIAFDGETRHLIPETSDLYVVTKHLTEKDGILTAKGWKDNRLKIGTRLAMRTWNRPAPGLFMADDIRTKIKNVKMHYAEGMGLLAQMCEDIDIDGFSVCLRGDDDPRYFTTQADATHFSGCRGLIRERNGLYEGMMDDAINVHGTYLKVVERVDDHTLIGQYMHEQSYGFRWGEVGDTVQFIQSNTMELTGGKCHISKITPVDKEINQGVTQFRVSFTETIPYDVNPDSGVYGIENLTWTPRVIFENNIIRNNRARGSLFSTPRKVIVRYNLYDHTSGCAILLCGDCNGWFETGACRDVLIEKNRFINALTMQFQFTNAVISIYPEIPDLKHQQKYFHSGIVIRNNLFETFDRPLLYAKSVDGLKFHDNKVVFNHDFEPIHWNNHCFWLQRVNNFDLKGTKVVGSDEDIEKDVVTYIELPQ